MRKCLPIALAVAIFTIQGSLYAQDEGISMANLAHGKGRSDREEAGVRGPARSVIEERTYPAWTDAQGNITPAIQQWNKTEYDRDGRLAASWWRGPSRERGPDVLTIIRYSYGDSGQLLRRTSEVDGKIEAETRYEYDDRGRIISITSSGDADNPIAFSYDANGRKTKIAVAKPSPLSGGESGAMSYSPGYLFGTESGAVRSPEGGSTATLYDDHDRPIELQVRNASGDIVYRILREYDAEGNVISEKQTMEDVLRIIPAAQQKKITDDAGVSSQELRDQIAKALGGGSEMSSTKFVYDTQGRETLRIERSLGHIEQRVETAYNTRGDVAREIWHSLTTGMPDAESNEDTSSERTYTYEYDTSGNWNLKKTSSRQLPDGELKDTGEVERRTIEYY